MPITLLSQLEQIASSATYDDTLDPNAVGESQVDLQGDMNVVRSLFKTIKGTADWYTPHTNNETIETLIARPNVATSLHLVPIQPIDGTGQSAVSGTAGQTSLALSGITSGDADNSESGTTAGAFAVQLTTQTNFDQHNVAEVRKANSRERMTTTDGNDVYGFLQVSGGPLPVSLAPGDAPITWSSVPTTITQVGQAYTKNNTGDGNSITDAVLVDQANPYAHTADTTVECTYTSGTFYFGFADSTSGLGADLFGGWFFRATFGGNLEAYDDTNTNVATTSLSPGDTIAIRINNGAVDFLKNDVSFFTDSGATGTFYASAALVSTEAIQGAGNAASLSDPIIGGVAGSSLSVKLKYVDNAGAWQDYTLTAGDVADGGFDVTLFKIQSLGSLSRYAFMPGAEFLDVAQDSQVGSLDFTTNNYVTDGQSVTAAISALDAEMASQDSRLDTAETGIDNLQTYTGSAGDTDVDPAYSSTTVVVQGSSLTTAIGALDAAHNAHLTDTEDAHDASAISTTGITGVLGGTASNVQLVLAELKQQIDDNSPEFADTLLGANYAPNDNVTVPSYTVGAVGGEYARFTYNGTPLVPGASNDYVEVGVAGSISTTIQTKRSLTTGKYLTSLILK